MKKFILLFALFTGAIVFSQKAYNQFSIEVDYGLSLPFTPIPKTAKAGTFVGFGHFALGARYMISPKIGLKLSYAHDNFHDKNLNSTSLVYNRVDIQAVSNLVYLFDFRGHVWERVGLLAHAGGGFTSGDPSAAVNNEKVANIIFGITPLYRLGDKFALCADLTYVVTTKQQFGFDGQLIEPNFNPATGFESFTGGFINFSIGLKYYIGKNRDHADWQ